MDNQITKEELRNTTITSNPSYEKHIEAFSTAINYALTLELQSDTALEIHRAQSIAKICSKLESTAEIVLLAELLPMEAQRKFSILLYPRSMTKGLRRNAPNTRRVPLRCRALKQLLS